MTFRIGQKVICIEPRGADPDYPRMLGVIEPDLNDVCTVTNVYMARCGEIAIEVAEFPSPGGYQGGILFEPGWLAKGFRPIVERKTDIGFAHEILRKATKQAPAARPLVPSKERDSK